jgi:hypothetical protein
MTDGSTHRAPLPHPESLTRGGADREPRWGGQLPSRAQRAPMHSFAAQEDKIG